MVVVGAAVVVVVGAGVVFLQDCGVHWVTDWLPFLPITWQQQHHYYNITPLIITSVNNRQSYPGDIVKVVITRDQSVLQVKLAPLLERRLELLLELGDICGEVDVVEFYPLQTHWPVHIRQFPGDPAVR